MQACLERVLFIWAFRHPACSYVQGMNDLVVPFLYVFLCDHCDADGVDGGGALLDTNSAAVRQLLVTVDDGKWEELEADVYWCFKQHLEPIQDHYTENQPGIQRRLQRLSDLLLRVDPPLHKHFDEHTVQMMQFAYKWMNCLLVRELPLDATVRLWDTYLCEGDGYADLHVFVCLALLTNWSERLRTMDFAQLLQFLQSPPTEAYERDREVGELVSRAYLYQQLYPDA